MKKIVLLLVVFFIGECRAFAFDIVYPKKNDVIINAESTFFIGSSNTPLTINGEKVPLHKTGAFAYVVKLQDGINTFFLTSGEDRKIYIITKPKIKGICNLPQNLDLYKQDKFLYVTTENAPLRSTPINAGINRMAHLQRNIELVSDGEKGGFYRIKLGNKKYGWIAKSNVKTYDTDFKITPAKMNGYEYIDSDEFYTYVFHLDKRVPFEIVENNPFLIRFYNVKDQEDNIFVKSFDIQKMLLGKGLLGYSGEYQGNDFILKIRKPVIVNQRKPLHNIKIALDAGHGGYEFGAISCLGQKEKDLTLNFVKLIKEELKKRGAKVVLTRSDDSYVGLKNRVDIANREDATVLISIHGNALPDGQDPNKHSGTSIYYYYDQAKPLADVLMETVVNETGVNNDKVRQRSLALVRNTSALSLLIEVSYLINPEDNSKMINQEFQKLYAKAIVDGLEKYFNKFQ